MRRAFEHVIIVFHENQFGGMVLRNDFMRGLLAHGIDLASYHGCYHPSQTNYLAAIAGQVCGIFDDEAVFPPLLQQTVVDMMDSTVGNLRWRAYMEDYPCTAWNPDWCSPHPDPSQQPPLATPGTPHPPYRAKHNPFVQFKSIQRSASKWACIVDYTQLERDIERGDLPNFAWVTPNMWNDGHYIRGTDDIGADYGRLVDQSAEWVEQSFLPVIGGPKCEKLPPRSLVLITWDEAGFRRTSDRQFYEGPNQIYGVILGPDVTPSVQWTPYNHYSLLRTIERNFELADLGANDRGCNSFRFLWDEAFAWSAPEDTGLAATAGAALSAYGSSAALVLRNSDGTLSLSTYGVGGWSLPRATGLSASGDPALAEYDGSLMLVYPGGGQSGEGELLFSRLAEGDTDWSEPVSLGVRCVGTPVLCTYTDAESGELRMMCAFRRAERSSLCTLQYFAAGKEAVDRGDGVAGWDPTVPQWWPRPANLPYTVEGRLALGYLPETLILVWNHAREHDDLHAISHNTAPWNAVAAGFPDDTTVGLWSPRSYKAQFFPGRPDESEGEPFRCRGPLAMAPLDGELHLVHRSAEGDAVQHAVYSLSGTMTSKHVLGNDFGTLGEAVWGRSERMEGVAVQEDGILVAARVGGGGRVMVVFAPPGSDTLRHCTGGFGTPA